VNQSFCAIDGSLLSDQTIQLQRSDLDRY